MNSLRETGMDSENNTCRHRHGNTEVINHEQTCEQLRKSYLPGVRRRSRGMCFCSYRTHRSSPGAPHCLEPHSPGAANTERQVTSRGRQSSSHALSELLSAWNQWRRTILVPRTIISMAVMFQTHPTVQPVLTHDALNHLILHLHTRYQTGSDG